MIFKDGVGKKLTEFEMVLYLKIIDDNLYAWCLDDGDDTTVKSYSDWVFCKFDLDGGNQTELFRTTTSVLSGDYNIHNHWPQFDEFENAFYYFISKDNKQILYKYSIAENTAVSVASYDSNEMRFAYFYDEHYFWMFENQPEAYYRIDRKTWELKKIDALPENEVEEDITSDGYTYFLKDEHGRVFGGTTLYRKPVDGTKETMIADLTDIPALTDEPDAYVSFVIAGIENGKALIAVHGHGDTNVLLNLRWIDIETGAKTKIY